MPCEIGNMTAMIEAIMVLFKIYRDDCETFMIELSTRPNEKQPKHINFLGF